MGMPHAPTSQHACLPRRHAAPCKHMHMQQTAGAALEPAQNKQRACAVGPVRANSAACARMRSHACAASAPNPMGAACAAMRMRMPMRSRAHARPNAPEERQVLGLLLGAAGLGQVLDADLAAEPRAARVHQQHAEVVGGRLDPAARLGRPRALEAGAAWRGLEGVREAASTARMRTRRCLDIHALASTLESLYKEADQSVCGPRFQPHLGGTGSPAASAARCWASPAPAQTR